MRIAIPIILAVLIIIGVAILVAGQNAPSMVATNTGPTGETQPGAGGTAPNQPGGVPGAPNTAGRPSGTLFRNSSAAPFAYQIAPGALSANAQRVLTGYSMKEQTLGNGAVQVALSGPGINRTYTVQPGYKLYFVDRFPGDDDRAAERENQPADDQVVLVDPNGYIMQ